jgi:hypothetical protein
VVFAVTENGYISLTNSWRTEPIVRKDTLATSLSGIASAATVTKNTEVYWPALGTTLNSCWDAFSINGGGGSVDTSRLLLARRLPQVQHRKFMSMRRTTQHHNRVEAVGEDAFVRNGSTVTEIELAENRTQVVLFHVPIFHRYYAISMHEPTMTE